MRGMPPAQSKNGRATSAEKKTAGTEWNYEDIKKDLSQLLKNKVAYRQELRKHQVSRAANYVYLYDDCLKEKEYKPILANIERRLADFEITGKVIRLTSFSNPRVIIEDELRRGVGTMVIVGNDDTLARIFFRAADLEVNFGFLPVGIKNNNLAEALGIPLNEKACDVLAARKIEKIDYGIVNQKYFFVGRVVAPAGSLQFSCDERFSITAPPRQIEAAVCNLLPPPFDAGRVKISPQDGRLEFYLQASQGGLFSRLSGKKSSGKVSVFHFKRLILKSHKSIKLEVDGHHLDQEGTTVIEVGKKKLALIVGKNRKF